MNTKKLVKLTEDLIKFRTVRPVLIGPNCENKNDKSYSAFNKEIDLCMDHIIKELDSSIMIEKNECFIGEISCPILIAKFYNTNKPDLLLLGHIDVVPAESPQFVPFQESGKLFGRGSKDMKSGVAVMVEIMNYYAKLAKRPNIALAIVSDEESGGFNGAGKIASLMNYHPKLVITPDPGEEHCIITKEKGFIWFTVDIHGKSSHPSRPWLGDCAITKAMNLWDEISKEYNLSQNEEDWESSACILDIKRMRINPDKTLSEDNSTSVSDLVRCRFDIRYTEKQNAEEIKEHILQIAQKYGCGNNVCFNNTAPICFTPDSNELLQKFKIVADKIEGKEVPLKASSGASDLRFFSEKGIPCLNYGPQGKNHHRSDEYVEIQSLATLFEVLKTYINENFLERTLDN
ncbi:MAG: M20/M25/M40 family metallo-hydrolase [Bacteroidota bacterium]|nr:M20/M25/M40 family metallo-hydrolase [Bacteroidota bacterium]MDP4196567.1 M20/M25/M40 family metallo-hydrolase [Bacteroidota bacterium]